MTDPKDVDDVPPGPLQETPEAAPNPWQPRGFIPAIGVILSTVTAVAILDGTNFWNWTLLAFAYILTPIGQEAWLATGPTLFDRTVWEVLVFLFAIDTAVACFFIYGVDPPALMQKFPRVAARINRFHAKVHESKMAEYGLPIALAVILLLPIHSGGAVIGSLTGSLIGLRKEVTLTVVLIPILIRFFIAAGLITAILSWFA